MFKDTKDYIALAAIIGIGLLLYTINTLTLNVIVLGLVSVLLIVVVLIQNPKGGGLDSTFGGAAAGTQMFGAAQSTDFIERVTWLLVIALFFLCVITTIMPSYSGSVLEGLGQ